MVRGYCDEKFTEAREVFSKSITSGFELGAAISMEIEGETVLDLWGGVDNPSKGTQWQEDTIVNVFSSTKGIAAICLLQLVEQGKLDLDSPVARYWPEFAQGGKETIPVRYLFCHKSGLCGIRQPLDQGAFCDWELICNLLAAQEPFWEPGTAHGYHAITYGHLVGEVLRRIDGRTIGQYFKEEIAEPLDLDFWIGLPDSEFSRVTNLNPSKPSPMQFLFPLIGNRPKEVSDGLLHQGLAARDFIKKFVLSDDMVIKGAALSNGMLYVGIERIIPDEKKPRKIKLTSKSKLLG